MHERVPIAVVVSLEEQTLDRTAGRIATPEQARRKDARVVDDDNVACVEERRKITEPLLAPRRARAIDDEQPRSATRTRCLRNQRRREIEVEIRNLHFSQALGTWH